MSIVFEKPPMITQLLMTNTEKAKALEDPLRVAIIDMLSHRSMSIEEMVTELKSKKFNKAPTTIRHHIDILKDAGLVELVKLKATKGGGLLKYYASNTKLLNFNRPKEFENELKGAIEEISSELIKLMSNISKKYSDKLKRMAENLKPCSYCNTQHFVEFLLLEILRSATVEAIKNKEFSEILKQSKMKK